jgi:peptide/nickel transport system substrate-binding protein
LRFAVPQGPPHLDPHLTVSSGLLSWGAAQAYSRLFKFDVQDDGNAVVVCDLCESWVQPVPLTFSIKLREDVRWQNLPPLNGRTLTAQDVVFSLTRQATSGYPNSALLSNIAEFTVVNEHEFLIRLKSPDSETFEKLADPHSRIVSVDAVNKNGDLRSGPTVGTGPWIASEVQANRILLIANPDYYNDAPYLDGLEIQVIPATATRVAGMRVKILDLAQAELADIENVMERFKEVERISMPHLAAGVEIALNTARSPMDSPAVREAMMLAWNPEEWSEDFWAGESNISSGLPLLNPEWKLPVAVFEQRFNDPAKAESLLASSELNTTDEIIVKVGEFGQQYIDQATAMVKELSAIGIRAKVERISTRNFGDEVWVGGDYDIAIGAAPPISSTTASLFAIHHSDGPWNTTGYNDPEIDRLIEAQTREYDIAKRGDMLIDLQRRILAGSYRFIASTRTTHWMFWDWVHDFNPVTPRGDTDFLTKAWLTERPS